MSQGYPDPPMTSQVLDKKGVMEIIWNKWFQGLRVVVNRLSGGLGIKGTFALAKLTPAGTQGSITISDGVVTKITPST